MARNGKRSRSRSRDKHRRRSSASPGASRQFKSGRGLARGTGMDGLFSYVPDLERHGHLVGEATSGNIPWEGRLRGPDAPSPPKGRGGYRPTTPTPTPSGRRVHSHHPVKVPPPRSLPRPRDLHPPMMFAERGPEARKQVVDQSPLFADSTGARQSGGQMGAPNGAGSHQPPLTHPKRLSFVKRSREELLGRWRRDHEEEMCSQHRESCSQPAMTPQPWSPSADSSSATAVEARQREWEAHQERQRYTNWKIHPKRSSTPPAWQSGGGSVAQPSTRAPVMDNLPPMKLFTRGDYSPVESSPGPDESPPTRDPRMGCARRDDRQPVGLGILDSPVFTPPKSRPKPRRERVSSEDDWLQGQWEDTSSCEEDSQTGSPDWFTSTSETSPDSHSPYYSRNRSRSRSRSGRGGAEASWTPTAVAHDNWARGLRGTEHQPASQMWR